MIEELHPLAITDLFSLLKISDNTMNRYQYHSGDLSENPWISFPNNGGDVGDVFDLAEELNRLRDALIRLNSAVVTRMSADEPTGDERLELLRASEHAREIIGENAEVRHGAKDADPN